MSPGIETGRSALLHVPDFIRLAIFSVQVECLNSKTGLEEGKVNEGPLSVNQVPISSHFLAPLGLAYDTLFMKYPETVLSEILGFVVLL